MAFFWIKNKLRFNNVFHKYIIIIIIFIIIIIIIIIKNDISV